MTNNLFMQTIPEGLDKCPKCGKTGEYKVNGKPIRDIKTSSGVPFIMPAWHCNNCKITWDKSDKRQD